MNRLFVSIRYQICILMLYFCSLVENVSAIESHADRMSTIEYFHAANSEYTKYLNFIYLYNNTSTYVTLKDINKFIKNTNLNCAELNGAVSESAVNKLKLIISPIDMKNADLVVYLKKIVSIVDKKKFNRISCVSFLGRNYIMLDSFDMDTVNAEKLDISNYSNSTSIIKSQGACVSETVLFAFEN